MPFLSSRLLACVCLLAVLLLTAHPAAAQPPAPFPPGAAPPSAAPSGPRAGLSLMVEAGVLAVTLRRPFESPVGFSFEQPWRAYHGTLTGVYAGAAVMLDRWRLPLGLGAAVGSYQGGTFFSPVVVARVTPRASPIRLDARAGAARRPVLQTRVPVPGRPFGGGPRHRWAPVAGVALTLGQRFIRPRIAADAEYAGGQWAVQSSAGVVVVF